MWAVARYSSGPPAGGTFVLMSTEYRNQGAVSPCRLMEGICSWSKSNGFILHKARGVAFSAFSISKSVSLPGISHMTWGGHHYFLSWREPWHKFEDWDWFNGRNFCRDRCMDLVSFDTPGEYALFAAIMKKGEERSTVRNAELLARYIRNELTKKN